MEQLKNKQEVVFTIKDEDYTYRVYPCYLSSMGTFTNGQIFIDLNLDKYKFCSDCYGYKTDCGAWPNSKDKDYAALTRAVEALFPYCDKVTVDGKVVYSKSEKTIFKEPESSNSSSKSESSDIIDFESIVQTSKIKLTFI